MKTLIVGCGYVGLPLAECLLRQGHKVHGLRRSQAAAAELQSRGVHPLNADISRLADLQALSPHYDWVVNTAAAGSDGGVEAYRSVCLEGTRNLLEWLNQTRLAKLVYTSSIGVYGQQDGSWVDETAPTHPPSETAQVLVQTEQLLLRAAAEAGLSATVLRLAGIYGPGRGYALRRYLEGSATLDGSGGRIMNMIHRDDVVRAIIAALDSSPPREIYNVVDDEPVAQIDFYRWLSHTLHRQMPHPSSDPTALGRGDRPSNKRVSNRKLKQQLGFLLQYPTFREGCTAELRRLGILA